MNQIVSIQHRAAITTSLTVACVFRKRHKNVLQAIENLQLDLKSEGVARLDFQPRHYIDGRGKVCQMVEMNRDGFTLLAMGFTGKKALRFKLQYIDAFNRMERALLQRENLSWQHHRLESKTARRIEAATIARYVEYATSQGSQNARRYFVNVTKMTHQALNLMKQAGPQSIRDTIDSIQLSYLTTAEYMIQHIIEEGMAAGLPYKDIYQIAKESVLRYAATLPVGRHLAA